MARSHLLVVRCLLLRGLLLLLLLSLLLRCLLLGLGCCLLLKGQLLGHDRLRVVRLRSDVSKCLGSLHCGEEVVI